MVDNIDLDEIAAKELLNEAKRGAARASVYGALGWQKCPLKPTNKIFLQNMLLSAISSNRQKGTDHCLEKGVDKRKDNDDEAKVGKSNKACEKSVGSSCEKPAGSSCEKPAGSSCEKPAGSSCEKPARSSCEKQLQKNVLSVISSNRLRGSDHCMEKCITKRKYDDIETKVGKASENPAKSLCKKSSTSQNNVLSVISSNRLRGSDYCSEKGVTKKKYDYVESKARKSNKAYENPARSASEKPSNLQKNVLSVISSNRLRGSDYCSDKGITKRKYDYVESKARRSNKACENPMRISCDKPLTSQKDVLSAIPSSRQRGSDHCSEKVITKRKYDGVETKVIKSSKACEKPTRSSCERPLNLQKNVLSPISSNRPKSSDHSSEKGITKRKYDDFEAKVGNSYKACEKRARSSCEKPSNSTGSPVPSYFRQSEAGNKITERKDVKYDSRGKKDSIHHQSRTSHSNRKVLTRREEYLKSHKDYSRTHRKYDKV